MISPERTGLLKTFLGSLPEQIAARLAQAVEVDRLADGQSLPHEIILEGLRPALRRRAGAWRTPTPLRCFCTPFEDLFTAMPHQKSKQKGRIARDSVAPMWNWLGQTLLVDATRTYVREFKAATVAGRHADARALANEFRPVAVAAIHDGWSGAAGETRAAAVLGGELVLADVKEAALLLSVGSIVAEIQEKLVPLVPVLTDELLWALRGYYDQLVASQPDAAPYVAVIAMNRLARPWEALKLPLLISRRAQDTLISSTDMGLAGEIIFGDIEHYANAVKAVRHPEFDADQLVENVARFTSLSSGIVKGIEMRRDGKWGQRLMKDRAALADVMDGFMERAPKQLAAVLPPHKNTHSGGARSGELLRAADAGKVERALRYARLVIGCKPFAVAGSFAASVKKAEEEMCHMLLNYNEETLKELRAADAKRRVALESQFATLVKLTAVLFSQEEAELLRRRGRAAVGAKAA